MAVGPFFSVVWASELTGTAGNAKRGRHIALQRTNEYLCIEGTSTSGQHNYPNRPNHIIEIRYYDLSRRWKRIVVAVRSHQREIFTGLIRIHVLVHAAHEPIFGLAMMEELKHHGYRIGPGTLYPLLHGMERNGLLVSELMNVSGRRRRVYKITKAGKKTLKKAKLKVDELHHELHEDRPRTISQLDKGEHSR
jgi:PadR family transcriptional regulator PadR